MDVKVEAYRAELEERDRKLLAELEARLDFEARSEDIRHKRHLQRLLDVWSHALTELRIVDALGLTPMQYVAQYGGDRLNRFVACWAGNNTQAAFEAGYGTKRESAASAANLLMQMPVVVAAIREKIRNGITGKILSLKELQVLWSQDAIFGEDGVTRHKAREALAKTYGAFIQKVETNDKGTAAKGEMTPDLKELMDDVYKPR